MYLVEKTNQVISEQNVHIVEENLGNQIAGYLNHTFEEKLIHVNSEIPSYYKDFVIAYFLPLNSADVSSIKFLTIERLFEKFPTCGIMLAI